MGEYKFVNPYNFIPLSNGKSEASEEVGNYTGVIDYTVMTKTPLFIPNTSNDKIFPESENWERQKPKDENREKQEPEDENREKQEPENENREKQKPEDEKSWPKHKSYDFFTYTDLSSQNDPAKNAPPVIPGSEMRGMLRSNFEILTNSCLSAVDDDVVLSKRIPQPYLPGLIRREVKNGTVTYSLYTAKDERCSDSLDEYTEGELVPDENGKEYYVLKGEPNPNKTHRHRFYLLSELVQGNISLDTLHEVLKIYKSNYEEGKSKEDKSRVVEPYHEYKEQLEKFEDGVGNEYFPVFYCNDLPYSNLMLSPACITREIYTRKINDLIGDYTTCAKKLKSARETDNQNKTTVKLCPACSLFGTIEAKPAIASRIRFSDLQCVTPAPWFMEKVTLAPLSSPKLTSTEFYLARPKDAVFWTYDYYAYIGNNAKGEKEGKIGKNTCGINGRKFYWHDMKYEKGNLTSQDVSGQNSTIRPVKQGVKFNGKLYFKNITKTELDQLIFLINAGEKRDTIERKTHGYKLGSAKPLGLGSIAMIVNQVMLRKIDKDETNHNIKWSTPEYNEYVEPKFDEKIRQQFDTVTNFYFLNDINIDYPRKEDGGDIYEWFSVNHGKIKSKREDMEFIEYLEPMKPFVSQINSEGHKEEPLIEKPSEGTFIVGETYSATVTGTDADNVLITVEGHTGKIYKARCPEGKRKKLHNHFQAGEKLEVYFLNNDRGTYNFSCLPQDKK